MKGTCPACHGFFATVAKPHCLRFTCGWLSCRCGATVDVSSGKYYEIRGSV